MSVKVQGPDGATVEFPDGTAPAVMQSAMAAHYGGPEKPAAPAGPDYASRWKSLKPATARALIDKSLPKEEKDRAKYLSDPRIKALTQIAGPAPTIHAKQVAIAQQQADQHVATTGNFLTSLKAGITRGMFGLPEHLAAAAERFLPTAVTGNKTDASYNQILDQVRANTDADLSKSTGGNITGQIIGGAASGGAAGGLIRNAAGRLAGVAAPGAARVGNILENLVTVRKGQRVANAAKLVTSGAAAGAAQAAGTGEDVVKGAEYGAGGAAVLGSAAKVMQIASRPFRDMMRVSGANGILSRFTTTSREAMEDEAAAYRTRTSAEPTLFELLPLADRNKILKHVVVGRDNVVEQTAGAIRQRAANLGSEMQNRAVEILAPQRAAITRQMRRDMANARGGTAAADRPLVENATNSPTDLLAMRTEEANAIMAPHNDTHAADNLVDLVPHVMGQAADGTPIRIATDPEVSAAISAAAGSLRRRAQDAGVTAGDVSAMIVNLRKSLGKGNHIETANAQRAIHHLEDELQARAPEAADAHTQMTDAFAARSRMAEGMQEGSQTRLRDTVPVGTSGKQARTVRNAYDTPEGAAGRSLGQTNRVLTDLGGSADDALRATVKMSRNNVGRELAQNVGADESAALMAAAHSQDTSAQALAAASNTAGAGGAGASGAEDLVQALMGLHPGSFITTKAGAMRKLAEMTHIPDSRARTIVEMLFSQDRTLMDRAMRSLESTRPGRHWLQTVSRTAGQVVAGNSKEPAPTPDIEDVPAGAPLSPGAAAAPTAEPTAETIQIDENRPYGRQVVEQLFPHAQITEAVRDPKSKLGRENPGSFHVSTQNAVDVRPIPGMKFGEFIERIHSAGFEIVESIDEVAHPTKYATGKHWHVVIK